MTTEEELIKRVRELEDLVVFLAIDRNHDEAYVNWWYHNGGGQTMYRHDVATDTVHNSIINIWKKREEEEHINKVAVDREELKRQLKREIMSELSVGNKSNESDL